VVFAKIATAVFRRPLFLYRTLLRRILPRRPRKSLPDRATRGYAHDHERLRQSYGCASGVTTEDDASWPPSPTELWFVDAHVVTSGVGTGVKVGFTHGPQETCLCRDNGIGPYLLRESLLQSFAKINL
jgi:hypothetical protein